MKIYKSLFKEQEEDVKLEDIKLIDKLLIWFKNNPYPQDHNGLHKFADSIGIEADVLETYVYAILSCFIICTVKPYPLGHGYKVLKP